MKNLTFIPVLFAAMILTSCFGGKDEAPEVDPTQEAETAEPTTTPGESGEATPTETTGEGGAPAPVEPETETEPATEAEASSEGADPSETAPEPADNQNPVVTISTTAGDITIELFAKEAPETVANFLSYAKEGFYDDTVFHRVIKNFMVQGGGFGLDEEGVIKQKDTKDPIQNEAKNGLKNGRGTVAMARTSPPHSATSQFFINHKDNDNLDYPSFDGWGYAVFGKVTKGLDVVDAIADVPTGTKSLVTKVGPRPMEDVPNDAIVIQSVKVVE